MKDPQDSSSQVSGSLISSFPGRSEQRLTLYTPPPTALLASSCVHRLVRQHKTPRVKMEILMLYPSPGTILFGVSGPGPL